MDSRRSVVILEEPSHSREWFEDIFAQRTGWQLVFARDLSEMSTALAVHRDAMVLVAGTTYDEKLGEIVGRVQRCAYPGPVVYLADEEDTSRGSECALIAGVDEVVFDALLQQKAGLGLLRLAWFRQKIAVQKMDQGTRQLQQCQGNLELLDVLAVAVTSTIDRDELIVRALDVFAGICINGRAAYCELIVASGKSDVRPAASAMKLQCVGNTYSKRVGKEAVGETGLEVYRFSCEESEQELIKLVMADEVHLNIDSAADTYPLLNRLWGDISEGVISLIPVWSSGQALGLLTLYSRSQDNCTKLLKGDEPLRVMARVFGSAIQNSQLYEEVDAAYQTLQRTQSQLVHSEKFAAMGVLSAEIAHEFNNPASFVISNLSVMREYVEMISDFVEGLSALKNVDSATQAEIKSLEERYEIAFLREDLDSLIVRCLSGMQRIHQIVQDLRYFSHDVAQEPGWVDLEQLVSAVLHLVNHESRFRARLELDFCGLPQVFSDANKLSQVLLNLFVNAAHSIAPGNPEDNFIRVRTRCDGDDVVLSIQDSGIGIAKDILPKIFEPFFTTKERGSATGLGLPIVQDILRGLGGELRVSSEQGVGSLFEFQLPIRAAKFAVKKELRESGSYKTPPRSRRSTPVYRTPTDTPKPTEDQDE